MNYSFLHQLAQVKLTGAETDGAVGIVEVTSPGGPAAPLHVHRREAETFCVLEGELTLFVGDEVVRASAGDVVYAPANIPHTYNIDSPMARILVISSPAGFEQFVTATARTHGVLFGLVTAMMTLATGWLGSVIFRRD